MKSASRWFVRNSLFLLTALLLVGSVALLIVFRFDPNFGTISTLLGVLIGGSTTSFLQLATQSRERALRLEDEQRERIRMMWQKRVERAKYFFVEFAMISLKSLDLAGQARHDAMLGDLESGRKLDDALKHISDSRDFRAMVESQTIMAAMKSPLLDELRDKLEQKSLQIWTTNFNQYSNKEFAIQRVRYQRELYDILGSAFTELDRIELQYEL